MAALPKGSPEFIAKVQEMKAVSAQVKEREARLKETEEKFRQAMLALPNLPHASVPDGAGPDDNVVHATHGDPAGRLGRTRSPIGRSPASTGCSISRRGAKVTGAGFPFYIGDGARLVRALLALLSR